jgi:hypothetical protein
MNISIWVYYERPSRGGRPEHCAILLGESDPDLAGDTTCELFSYRGIGEQETRVQLSKADGAARPRILTDFEQAKHRALGEGFRKMPSPAAWSDRVAMLESLPGFDQPWSNRPATAPEAEFQRRVGEPFWAAQFYRDGSRLLGLAAPGLSFELLNETGRPSGAREALGMSETATRALSEAAARLGGFALEGVHFQVRSPSFLPDTWQLLDLCAYRGHDLRAWPFGARHALLRQLFDELADLGALPDTWKIELVGFGSQKCDLLEAGLQIGEAWPLVGLRRLVGPSQPGESDWVV